MASAGITWLFPGSIDLDLDIEWLVRAFRVDTFVRGRRPAPTRVPGATTAIGIGETSAIYP